MTHDRPILVVGCPRSGTTLLQLMLHAHPRIAIPPENRFVLAAYGRRWRFGDLTREANRRRLARWIVDRDEGKFADLGLDPDEVAERIVAAGSTLGSALREVLTAYAARFGKPRWGDKRPAYLWNLDALLRLFPTAQIVNIVRDGRDCVASLKEMPWHRSDIYRTVAQWAAAADHAKRAARRLSSDSFYQLRYEDLVAEPERELNLLCAYLGEEFHPAMREPNLLAPVAVPAAKVWHQRTHAPVTTERVGSWSWRLEAWEIELCEAALGSRLRSLGYDVSGAGRPALAHRLRYEQATLRHRFSPVKRAVAGMRESLLPEQPLAATGVAGETGHPHGAGARDQTSRTPAH